MRTHDQQKNDLCLQCKYTCSGPINVRVAMTVQYSESKLMVLSGNCARKRTVGHIDHQQDRNRIEVQFAGHEFCWFGVALWLLLMNVTRA